MTTTTTTTTTTKNNNKPVTIENKYIINDLLIEVESLTDTFLCSICSDFIYKKIILQCVNGCWSCQDCWKKHLEFNKKQCPQCRCEIKSIDDLSRSRFIEKEFNKQLIYCPNSFKLNTLPPSSTLSKFTSYNKNEKLIQDKENGCDKILKVEDLKIHTEFCYYRFTRCKYNGCDFISRFSQIDIHEEDCQFRYEYCTYCKKEDIPNFKYYHHISNCSEKPVSCHLCHLQFKKELINDHLLNECEENRVNCNYWDVGCLHTMKRKQLNGHLKSINHSIFIDKKFELQSQLIKKLTSTINELSIKIEDEYSKTEEICSYKNKWIISNYLKPLENFKNGDFMTFSIESPSFKVGKNKCTFICGIEHEINNLSIKLMVDCDDDVKYSITLLNHLNSNLNKTIKENDKIKFIVQSGRKVQKNESKFDDKCIKSNEISKSNGWLNENGEMFLEFSVKMIKDKEINLKTDL